MKKEKIMSNTKYKPDLKNKTVGVQVQIETGSVLLYKGNNDIWLEIEDYFAECKNNLRIKKLKNIIEDNE